MSQIETTFLYDKKGTRYRCNLSWVDHLMKRKGWHRQRGGYKKKVAGPPASPKEESSRSLA
jgi:hypothetical protein